MDGGGVGVGFSSTAWAGSITPKTGINAKSSAAIARSWGFIVILQC